jgi:hypothetical protein
VTSVKDWLLEPGAGLGCLFYGPPEDDLIAGLAKGAGERGWSVLVARGLAADDHRAAGRELETGLKRLAQVQDVGGTPLVLVGVGSPGTVAFLQACRSKRVAALAIVDVPLILEDLDVQRPVQPLEMLLNLEAPLLRVESTDPAAIDPQQGQLVGLQLDACARIHESHSILSDDLRAPLVLSLLETFLSNHLESFR